MYELGKGNQCALRELTLTRNGEKMKPVIPLEKEKVTLGILIIEECDN